LTDDTAEDHEHADEHHDVRRVAIGTRSVESEVGEHAAGQHHEAEARESRHARILT